VHLEGCEDLDVLAGAEGEKRADAAEESGVENDLGAAWAERDLNTGGEVMTSVGPARLEFWTGGS
jgi:hypothetical protein